MHPEAAYKRNQYSGAVVGVAGSGVVTRGRGAKMTATVPVDMRTMAVGDVNGDGQKEILLLAGQDLLLYGTRDKAIVQLAKTSLPASLVIHAVNLADLDGDGKEEIYLSGTDGLYVSSMIMQYDPPVVFRPCRKIFPGICGRCLFPAKAGSLPARKEVWTKLIWSVPACIS